MKVTPRVVAPITGLLMAALASAGPFDPALVGAEARWVIHIDVDGAREAEGLRRLVRGHMRVDEHDVERLQRRLGVQIAGLDADDFSFICAYGAGDGDCETAIIGASPGAVDWFVSWMSRAGEAEADQQAEQWLVRSWRRHGRLTAMATVDLPAGGSAMVIADSVEEIVAAAKVVTGAAPSLADAADSPLQARPGAGSIVFLAAEDVDEFKGLRPRAVALREAKRLLLDFGESGGQMFLEARITAADPEHAAATRDVLNGLRAWGRMAIAQSERASQCAPLLDALTLRVEGADVLVSWRAEVATLPEAQPAPEGEKAPAP